MFYCLQMGEEAATVFSRGDFTNYWIVSRYRNTTTNAKPRARSAPLTALYQALVREPVPEI